MNFEFHQPDKVMIGVRGEVGARLFLLQVREGRRLVIIKCEKQQLKALADWIASVLESLGRPGHLHDDVSLEPEYEVDFVAGDVTVSIDNESRTLDVEITSVDDQHSLSLSLTPEWAGALAIGITRLVEAGRPPCPLCALPLDPRGHDCPRTNGNSAPLR